jgi:hypothetical protein
MSIETLNKVKLRSYAGIFSGSSFAQMLKTGDLEFINKPMVDFDLGKIGKSFETYADYLSYVYRILLKEYRCEYIYKNEIINELLLKQYGTRETVVINEFKVGNSVADMVMFNGVSKAFEIKTELDTDKRLNGQLSDYQQIFQESYIVTHESLLDKYLNSSETCGLILFQKKGRAYKMIEVKKAVRQKKIDAEVLIRSVRTEEYKNIIINYYGNLPRVNSFNMFDACEELMKQIPQDSLHQLFVAEIKKRVSNTGHLTEFNKELRHLCLSMKIKPKDYPLINNKLNQTITI